MPARVGAQRWHPVAGRGRRREVLEQWHWVLRAFLQSAERTVAAVGGHERTAVRRAATLTRSRRSLGQRAPSTWSNSQAARWPCALRRRRVRGPSSGGAGLDRCARLARGVRRRDVALRAGPGGYRVWRSGLGWEQRRDSGAG